MLKFWRASAPMPNYARLSKILFMSDSVNGLEKKNKSFILGSILVSEKLEPCWSKATTEAELNGRTNSSKPSKSISALIIPLGIKPIGVFRSKG